MRRVAIALFGSGGCFGILGLCCMAGLLCCRRSDWPPKATRTTIISTSPDKTSEIALVEHAERFDRNFFLVVKTSASETNGLVIFESPDEGSPPGTERFLWSSNSAYVLLLGRRFFIPTACKTSEGEFLYLMYALSNGCIWCNSEQQNLYPAFRFSDIADKGFPSVPKAQVKQTESKSTTKNSTTPGG